MCCVIAPFFQDAVSESNLDEMEVEILRNKLYKVTSAWLMTKVQHQTEATLTNSSVCVCVCVCVCVRVCVQDSGR